MLMTSPTFMFLFLPCALILYASAGKRHRRTMLLLICLAFHVACPLLSAAPWNLLYLPALILYTEGAGRLLRRVHRFWLALAACLLPYVGMFALRTVAYLSPTDFVYPVGLTVACVFSTSYLVTQYRSTTGRVGNVTDLCLYLGFFPVMIVGPILRFPTFCEAVQNDRISFDVSYVASGVRLFAIGFIKRIGVGAVFYEVYDLFFGLFGDTPDLIVSLFLMLLLYFAVFFTISGYLDMGTGLARMFGLKLAGERNINPFRVTTFHVYLRGLFGSLMAWIDEYLIDPVLPKLGKNSASLYRSFCYSVCFFFFIRMGTISIWLSLVMGVFLFLSERLRLQERSRSSALRGVFSMLTIAAVSIVWIFLMFGTLDGVFHFLESIRMENPEYHIDRILVRFSITKYLVVVALAALTLYMRRSEALHFHATAAHGGRLTAVREYVAVLLLLLAFLFVVIFFLPGYASYDLSPFLHLYI